MTTDYRDRFGLSNNPFDKTCLRNHIFESSGLKRLKERFQWLLSDRGIGILTGPPGVGKTACLHTIIQTLPAHRYPVFYLEDALAKTNDLYRTLAWQLGLVPAFRRSTLWHDIKQHLIRLNDQNDQQVILVIDDAHKLASDFLYSLTAFLNFLFDSREILTLWLIGDPYLTRLLTQTTYCHLMSRVRLRFHMEPMTKTELSQYINACLTKAGCTRSIIGDVAMDAVFHISKGIPRVAGNLITAAMRLAHLDDKDTLNEFFIEQAREVVLV